MEDRSFRKARLRLQTIPGASQTFLGLRHAFLPHQYPIWGPVHTYPNNFESATFPFRIQLPSTRIQWIRLTNPQLFRSALQVPWVPETFLARFPVSVKSSPLVASAYGRRCVGLRPTPKIPTACEKNLWYPGYSPGRKFLNTLWFRNRVRLRVVHFSSGIVERKERERPWKSPHARKGDTRSRVGWFSRALVFRSLYYPWGKMGDYS